MKKTLLAVAVILFGVASVSGQTKTANVWEPGKTLPTYRVRQQPNGDVRIYSYGDPFQYQYRIEPDGRIYKYGNPFQPVGEIKNGLSITEKGGEIKWQF